MHINILERQELRRGGLFTFHIHNPVQSKFHQKAFSNIDHLSQNLFLKLELEG